MSDSHDDLALKRRRRRDWARLLAIVIVVLPVWWYGYHWIERRFAIDDNLARFAVFAVIMTGCWVATALGLDGRHPDDPQSLRLRHLARQRDEQRRDRVRWLWVVSLGLLLLVRLPTLLDATPRPHSGHPAAMDWDAIWIMLMFLTSTGLGRSIAPTDTAALSRHLAAQRLGFATMLLLGIAALVRDGYQPQTLPRTLPVAFILGLLAQQVHLMLHRPAAIPEQP